MNNKLTKTYIIFYIS